MYHQHGNDPNEHLTGRGRNVTSQSPHLNEPPNVRKSQYQPPNGHPSQQQYSNRYPSRHESLPFHRREDGSPEQVGFLANYEAFLKTASDLLSAYSTYGIDSHSSESAMRTSNMQRAVLEMLPVHDLKDFCCALKVHYNGLLQDHGPAEDQYAPLINRCELELGDYLRTILRLQEEENMVRGRSSGWKQGELVYNDCNEEADAENYDITHQHNFNQKMSNPNYRSRIDSRYDDGMKSEGFSAKGGVPLARSKLDNRVYPMLSPQREALSDNQNFANISSEYQSTLSPRSQRNLERSAGLRRTSDLLQKKLADGNEDPSLVVINTKANEEVYSMYSDILTPDGTKRNAQATVAEDRAKSESRTADIESNNVRVPKKPLREVLSCARVMAPEALPEGFAFEASIGEKIFMAIVPKGGVEKGEIFESPIVDPKSKLESRSRNKVTVDMQIPRMKWRDGLYSCLSYGLLHPLLLNSFFCPQVALAQIIARLKGKDVPGTVQQHVGARAVGITFSMMLGLHFVIAIFLWRAFLYSAHATALAYSCIPLLVADLVLICYYHFLVIRTRREMQLKYHIPSNPCVADPCVSIFCTPCVLSQMGRHTADYDTYIGRCCTQNGLPPQIDVELSDNHTYSPTNQV